MKIYKIELTLFVNLKYFLEGSKRTQGIPYLRHYRMSCFTLSIPEIEAVLEVAHRFATERRRDPKDKIVRRSRVGNRYTHGYPFKTINQRKSYIIGRDVNQFESRLAIHTERKAPQCAHAYIHRKCRGGGASYKIIELTFCKIAKYLIKYSPQGDSGMTTFSDFFSAERF